MMMPQIIVAAIAAVVMAFFGGRIYEHPRAKDEGRAEVQAEWDRAKIAQQAVVDRARAERDAAEDHAIRQMRDQTNAHTEQIRRRDAAAADARRELARLRDRIATDAIGRRERAETAGPGPAPDGAPAVTGQLLGECAGRLVEVGEQAGRLAGQVTGLQSYARLAVQTCGR